MKPLLVPLFAAAILSGSLAGCGRNAVATAAAQPREVTRATVCSLDGMTLADYPGPKGQIVYRTGEPDFFCDTVELVSILLRPERQKPIAGVFVQDMAKTDWNRPAGHWIDARSAWYVSGSKRRGSMGPSLATFAAEADARAFAAKEGGRVLRLDQITPEMVQLDGGVMKDHLM